LNFYEPAGTLLALTAQFMEDSPNGQLEAAILVDDQVVESAKSPGNELVAVTGTIKQPEPHSNSRRYRLSASTGGKPPFGLRGGRRCGFLVAGRVVLAS
jgi:hypothetical protein